MNRGKISSSSKLASAKPSKNSSKKTGIIVIVGVITAILIFWVYTMGRKAEETVKVAMYANEIYKNEVITPESFLEYDMLKGEFEKYATDDANGGKVRRIVKFDEIENVSGAYAAYPLHKNTVAMWTDFVTSKVDNSDSVLYSFPGKNIVSLEIGSDELSTFKKFLQPGDRINITAIYKSQSEIVTTDIYGEEQKSDEEIMKQEIIFQDIMLADLLNGDGESILDIYTSYKDMSTWDQAALDASDEFKTKVEPSSILVAFTPEEESAYYEYLSRGDVEFKISLPQRTN